MPFPTTTTYLSIAVEFGETPRDSNEFGTPAVVAEMLLVGKPTRRGSGGVVDGQSRAVTIPPFLGTEPKLRAESTHENSARLFVIDGYTFLKR